MASNAFNWLAWTGLGLVLAMIAIIAAVTLMTRMPGRSHTDALPPLTGEEAVIRDRLAAHVGMLAGTIGERNVWRPAALKAAADYIEQTFDGLGYAPVDEPFDSRGIRVRNIVSELPGTAADAGVIVVGAHYDTVPDGPGANDNASGVAALLELARLLKVSRLPQTIRFVAFVNEERPFSYSSEMGSVVHAQASWERGDPITAMLSLETIGYFNDRPGTQHYPPPLSRLYPDRANFIGFIGNLRSISLVRRCTSAFRHHAAFPSEGAALPEGIEGVGWSDHWSFWQAGFPAVMVTDTAFFRYPHYHLESDTPDRLDYARIARVVHGLSAVIYDLARRDGSHTNSNR